MTVRANAFTPRWRKRDEEEKKEIQKNTKNTKKYKKIQKNTKKYKKIQKNEL